MPTVQDYQTQDDAYATQVESQKAAQAQKDAQKDSQEQPSLLQKWGANIANVTSPMIDTAVSEAQAWGAAAKRVGQDATAGAATAVKNTMDFVSSQHPDDPNDPANAPAPIWDHAKSAILDFRDAVAVKDPNIVDSVAQAGAQLAIPFAGYSRALAGVHGFANMVAAGAVTDATALGPHDARMADLIALGRHTEGKLGDMLRALTPDGSAQNAYISYLADRSNETEAEGRFKNVLDGFGTNLIVAPLLTAVGSILKQGTAGMRYLADNGVGHVFDMGPPSGSPGAQAGKIGSGRPPLRQGVDPAESIYADQARRDAATAAAAPPGTARPPLRQGVDPAEAIYADQARQDANRSGAPMAAPALAAAPSGLDALPAVTSFRKVLQSQAGTIDPLGDVSKGAARPTDLSNMALTLAKHLPDDGAEGSFYKDVLQRVAQRNVDSKLLVSSLPHTDGRAGSYVLSTGDTHLFPRALQSNTELVHTFAHEAVHAAVFKDIENSPITRSTLDNLRKQVADPIEAHNRVLESAWKATSYAGPVPPYKTTHYGTTNVQEFVAEAESNPTFRKAMQNAPAKDGRSVWENYKDTIAGVLGVGGVVAASPMFDKLLTKENTGA